MADFYSIPLEEMNAFLRSRRFQPVDLTYRNRPVMEWVYERPLPRQPNHVVRVYTGINRYGRSQNQSRGAGKDAIRVQVIYKNGDVETLVTQPKRVHRVTGWADNLDNRLTEIAQSLPQVVFDRRGEPMTLRRKNGKYFWGSRDYPKYKETKPFRAEQIRCCKECDKTTGLTTIQAGTYCYDCLPINLGAEEMFYYHGTDMTNLASILKEGIRPTADTDSRWGEDIMDISPYPYYYAEIDDILPSVFVADSVEEARWWADESGIEKIGVLKISSQVENLENFHGDGNGYKTSETIPKEYIVEVIGKTFAAEEFNSEQDAPLAGQTTEAPYEIKVYVPSTTLDQPISESDFKSRIDETQEKLSELFGGFTTVDASGGYLSQQDGVISEPVIVVSSWATVRDYQSKMGDLERFLKQKKDDWGQEVIGFEFENDFFMYPAFRAEEINLGAEDEIPIIDLNSKKEIEEYGLFRPYEPNPPRKEELRRASLTDAPENNNLFRINCDGVYAVRTIYGPSKIIFGRNMLASNKVSFNHSTQRNLSPVWSLMGLPRNKSGVVSAFGPLKNIEKMPQFSEKPVAKPLNRKKMTPNRIVINMKGLVFAYDIVNREVEFYGGVPESSIVSEDIPPEVVKPEMAEPKIIWENVRDYKSLLTRYNSNNRRVRQGLKGEIDVPDEEYIEYWNQFAAEDDIKLFYEGIYDNDGGFGDGNEMKSYSVVSKKDYRNYYEDTKWNPCECDVQGCLSCFLNEYPHQPQFTEGRIVSYGSLWFEDSVWDAETFAAADKNYRSEEIEDDFSIGDILISDLIPKEGDRMLYIPYPTKNDWRERYAAEGHIRVYIAKHNENNNFQIQWREITADRLNLLIDDAVAKLYIADYENTDDLYGKLFVTSEPIWKHLNYNAMLGESYSYMYRLVTSAIPFGGRTNDIFDYLHSGKNYRNSNANYTLNDLEYHDKEWRDRNLGGDPTILNTGFLDGIFADQLPDEKSFLSETYEEATGVEFSEQNPKKIEADAPQDWRESIITIPQSDSFGNALYRKMSDLTYNQVWRVLEIIDDLNRMSHHHALTKFSSNYVEIWIYSHDSGLVMPKDYHWAEDFNDMIATVDWQMWESETEWDDIDWDNSTPSDWGDDISWQDDWGSLRPETRPEFPTVDAKIASMLRNHSKVNVNGEQGCPGCGQEDLFYRESTGTGTKWYCYGCFYTEKTESQKSKKVITLEKYGLKVRCPDCNEMIVAYNQASVNSHRKKCGVTK